MAQAALVCNKIRSIASSDKSALSALQTQKSNKQKTKKEEKAEAAATETTSKGIVAYPTKTSNSNIIVYISIALARMYVAIFI